MKRAWITLCLAAALSTGFMLTGCEERVAHEKEVKVNDGEVTTKETTVTKTPEGDIKVEKKTTEEEPGEVKEKTETETFPNPNP